MDPGPDVVEFVWRIETRGLGTCSGPLGSAILTADRPTPTDRGVMEDELVATGRFVRIETRGERSGLHRPVTVGFVDDDETPGAILVAATAPDAAWARNLLADPTCHVSVGDRSFDAVAEPLAGADHARAVREMILRYGTPAEGLGRGPSFRLRPVGERAS
jgi:deazaflavin-dependent oxidoreductase (nitroreductase family)